MNPKLSRRDFLKVAGLGSLGLVIPPSIRALANNVPNGERPNILIIVLDAFSAYNAGIYGYRRDTTPNLAKLAERSTVFYNHYSTGNYTTPGTASLLTGSLPWTHRAIQLYGTVRDSFAKNNIFNLFSDYYRTAYTHNPLADALLKQFSPDIENYIPQGDLLLINDSIIQKIFSKDRDIATISWTRAIKREEGFSYSLFAPGIYQAVRDKKIDNLKDEFPYGIPNVYSDNYFTLEQGIDWLNNNLPGMPKPFLGYMHFFPPHFPYRPRHEFAGLYTNDGWQPDEKPQDMFTEERTLEFLLKRRMAYDEHIRYADSEFARLISYMESSGLLENTWVILTSDHGEMFERGIWAHSTPTLYEPVIKVPLMILEPGQKTGRKVFARTSSIDVLPTMLHVTGRQIPEWVEGSILPPYATSVDGSQNNIYAIQAKHNDPQLPLIEASVTTIQDDYKLIYYLGYEELGKDGQKVQLYNIKNDPEELSELSQTKPETTTELLHIVQSRLNESNEPYRN